MEKVIEIKELYFDCKKTLTEIAEILNLSISYISKVLRKDERYTKEKEERKNKNLCKRRKIQKELIYCKRKSNIDNDYLIMKQQHKQDINELSKHSSIGNETIRKWCSSAYKYNKDKKRYEFDTAKLLKPADFPLYIKT